MKNRRYEYFTGICRGLDFAITSLKLGKRLTFKTVTLPLKPKPLDAEEIRSIRAQVLNSSQSVFANVLNVSVKTVQAWEQNQNRPSGSALRLLRMIQKNPKILSAMK